MRITKFRVWNGIEWCAINHGYSPSDLLQGYPDPNDYGFIGDLIFQEWTGLYDHNNKEIYEGDIIKYNGNCDITYSLPGIVSVGEYFTHAKEFYHYGVRVKRIDMENSYFGLNLKDSTNYLIVGNILETKL